MKKTLSIVIVTVLCFMLVGCGKKDEQTPIINNNEIVNNVENQQQEVENNNEINDLINQSNNIENKFEYVATSGENGTVSTTIGLTSTENRAVFNFNDIYYLVYEFDGEKVKSLYYYYVFEDETTASNMCKNFKMALDNNETNSAEIIGVKQEGKYVIAQVNESVYATNTKTEIMEAYSYLQKIEGKEE